MDAVGSLLLGLAGLEMMNSCLLKIARLAKLDMDTDDAVIVVIPGTVVGLSVRAELVPLLDGPRS
jgi:hypothetical protein